MEKFRELFTEGYSSDVERELDQVIQNIAGDAMAAGLSVAETAIDNFESQVNDRAALAAWSKMKYSEMIKLAHKLAKQYQDINWQNL